MKNLLSLSFCLFYMTMTNYGQRNLAIATSDNSAMTSMFLNPANISGCSEKVVVNLFSANLMVDNNLGTFTQLSNVGSSTAFNVSGTNAFNMLAPAVDLHLPGILVSLNDPLQQSFAFTTRVRVMNQLNHFDPNLFSTVTSGSHSATDNYSYQSSNFNWTANLWSEVGITYALQVLDEGPHHVHAGVTLKYLGGISYLSLKGKNLAVSYVNGSDTVNARNSDIEFASNAVNSNSAVNNGLQASDVTSSLFGSKAGSGFGMDIGITYVYDINGGDKPSDQAETGADVHRLKASVAVTDIGAIKYNDANNFVVNVTGNGYVTGQGLSDNIKDWNSFRNYMVAQGFTADTGARATKLGMPTSLIGSIDYQIHDRFYVNGLVVGNLANRLNYGNSYYGQVSITPRYDTRRLTIAMPITYSMLANDMKLGLGLRFAGFFVGSDDMMALLSSNQHGFGVYFGGYVPLYKKKEKSKIGS